MKKINALILVLSIIIAAILWGYVVFDVNPEREKTVSGIPVDFINKQDLNNRDLMLVDGSDVTVNVRFTGRFQNIANVNKDTVKAVVDLRHVTTAGETMVEFALEGDVIQFVTDHKSHTTIKVMTDRIATKYVDLTLDFAGDIAEDYILDPAVFNPASIQIRGPAREIETVHTAVVRYEPTDPLSRSVVDRLSDYTLHTEDGEIVESEYITDDLVEPVRMSIPVIMLKTVKLTLDFIPGGGLKGENITWRIEPESIVIAGDPELLEYMGTIPIKQIDLAALRGDVAETVPIYLDEVRNLHHIEEAQVFITIEGVSEKNISTANVVAKGLDLPNGYEYSIVTNPITVTLRGPEDELSRVTPSNVRVVADFTGIAIPLPSGHISGPVTVYVDGFENVGAIDMGYTVVVEIRAETGTR